MSILKFKITEVVEVTRTRIVDVDIEDYPELEKDMFREMDYDKGHHAIALQRLTNLVRDQHSKEGDITELVIKAIRL